MNYYFVSYITADEYNGVFPLVFLMDVSISHQVSG